MAKLADLSLEDLYERKTTPAVLKQIKLKEDFTSINKNYCEKACKMCVKKYGAVSLLKNEVDALIIQNHHTLEGTRWQRDEDLEMVYQGIFHALAKTYLRGHSYRITDLTKCKPSGDDHRKGNGPTISKQMGCQPYLLQEIINTNPKVIIATTTEACKAIGLKASATGNRGELMEVEIAGRKIPVIVTIHAKQAQYIRQNYRGKFWGTTYFDWLRWDFAKAKKVIEGDLVVQDLQARIKEVATNQIFICRSMDQVVEKVAFLNNLPETTIVSFDIETTGLDPYSPDAKILCYQFGYRDAETKLAFSIVIPLWHRDNTWFDPDEAWPIVVEFLQGKHKKIAHNGKFDVEYTLVTTGVRVKNYWIDTILLLHWLNSGLQGSYGLKRAVFDFLPESGLGGYENQLPPLTKIKKPEEEASEDGEEEDLELETGDFEDL